jgi:hypothetical protein
MALTKETITLNFSQGLDTLDDPNQLAIGKFVSLTNSVFIKSNTGDVGALKKRNGFLPLPTTVSTVSYITNYNETLIGLGQGAIQQFSPSANAWINQGYYQPVSLGVQSLIKNSYSQGQQDSAIATNGIGCVAYASGNVNLPYQYALFDSNSKQTIKTPGVLSAISPTTNIIGQPKTFVLGSTFCIIYGCTSTGASLLALTQVQSYSPFQVLSSISLDQSLFTSSIQYSIGSGLSEVAFSQLTATGALFDGCVASNSIFLSYLSSLYGGVGSVSLGCNIVGAKISPSLSISSAYLSIGSYSSQCIGNAYDPLSSTIYTAISSSMAVSYLANSFNFSSVFSPVTAVIGSNTSNFPSPVIGATNITGVVNNGVFQSFYETVGYYTNAVAPFGSPRADNIVSRQVTASGVIGSETVIGLTLGLASKPFVVNGGIYMFATYSSSFQPGYFLINSTGAVISQFAYGNGGGYYYFGIPGITMSGNSVSVSYLQKDSIVPINTNIASNSFYNNVVPFYSQLGINQGTFNFSASSFTAIQSGNIFSVTGGFLWNYDGQAAFENNFFLYPEAYIFNSPGSGSSSSFVIHGISPQQFQYQTVFECSDAKGNVYQSTPGISNQFNFSGTMGSVYLTLNTSTPSLGYRLPFNPVKISLYRWSPSLPTFYKVGSFVYTGQFQTSGTVTSTLTVTQYTLGAAVSSAAFTPANIQFNDFTPDSALVGNEILYTTGNVVEDTPAPSFVSTDVWDERLWGISAEDGTLWYSKPIVENTPIEMNGNNFTLFVPPIQTSQGTAERPVCLAPLDEKQILFCKSAILYIVGSGPDITGANSQYSEPAQIPSQVGCSNQKSIVLTPEGIMFQSDNGIWLLGRNLAVTYIGKDVEDFNASTVTSAVCVPGTNEVRFSLNTGQRLVYDMLAGQWTSFSGPETIQSAAIINGVDTVLGQTGLVYQETQGAYLDNTTPVVMSFTTGWINLSGLQGYARAYWMEILGTFQSPHTYTVGIAYDYNPSIVQTSTINPYNVVGSGSAVEQWEVAFQRGQCQSFQLTFTEISSGTAGAGVMISGISLTYGKKKTFARNIGPKNKI